MEHCDRERGGYYPPSFFFMSRILYNIRDINFHPVVIECADGGFLPSIAWREKLSDISVDRLREKV